MDVHVCHGSGHLLAQAIDDWSMQKDKIDRWDRHESEGDNTLRLRKLGVFGFSGQEIRALASRALLHLSPSEAPDRAVIPPEQHLRDRKTFVLAGPGVLRVFD